MPVDLARRTMATIADLIPGAGFAVEDGRRVLFEDGYRFRPTLDNDRVLVSSTADLLSGPIVKLMVALPDADPAAGWARLAAEPGGTGRVHLVGAASAAGDRRTGCLQGGRAR